MYVLQDAFIISKGVSVPFAHFNFSYSGMTKLTSTSPCGSSRCEYNFPVSTRTCSSLLSIDVTVSAVNTFGYGL